MAEQSHGFNSGEVKEYRLMAENMIFFFAQYQHEAAGTGVRKKYGMSFQQMLYRTRVLAASRLFVSSGMTPLRYQRMSANETKRPQTDEIPSVVIREEETKCLS